MPGSSGGRCDAEADGDKRDGEGGLSFAIKVSRDPQNSDG